MNKFFLITTAVVVLGVVGCKSVTKKPENIAVKEDVNTMETTKQPTSQSEQSDMLIGNIERQQLETGKFDKWFKPRYDAYEVDGDTAMISNLLNGVDVTIFMGTWCPDSHIEVPDFYKVMDALDNSPDIRLIAVDRAKTTLTGLENGKNIQRVPTFIFTKYGEELGRIVEYPMESLEKDMIKILKGEDYKHAYEE